MSAGVVGRALELEAISSFLDACATRPAVLLLEGDAGIGKTTMWQAAVERARDDGRRVLLARPAATEAQLLYACLADLLRDVDEAIFRALPGPQRHAIEVVLLRGGTGSEVVEPRATGAAFLAVLERLAEDVPVLLAIDDLQWVDRSSAAVIEFAVRRLSSRVGVLAARRSDGDRDDVPWLRLPEPTRTTRLRVGPLSLGALREVLREHLGRSFPRPVMVRIQEVSGGNPFYALELARGDVLGGSPATASAQPGSLATLVAARIERVTPDVRQLLLAVSALADPTVELTLRAVESDPADGERLYAGAERAGLIRLDGHHVRFTHPLLAAGVQAAASASERRAMHRQLAAIVTDPEECARHLALGAVVGDPETIAALDEAASRARARGAPAAAAELADIAIQLGADSPERRLSAARHHFDAANPERARALVEQVVADVERGPRHAEALLLLATIRLHDDDYREAALNLEQALEESAEDLRLRVRIAVLLLFVLVNLGRIPDAMRRTDAAIADAERLADPDLLAKALASTTMIRFLSGHGLDELSLRRALALEDPDVPTPVMLRPTLIGALLLAWTGKLDEARDQLLAVRRQCLERGEESDLLFAAFHAVVIECWRGDLAGARLIAEDTMERALQLGTEIPLAIALSTQANVAAYSGLPEPAREAAHRALEIFQRGSCLAVTVWPMVTLGFLEVSLADYEAAATTLAPLAQAAVAMGYGEPTAAPFAPDTIEALIGLGRLDEAVHLLDQLEANGRRLDRAWALALGARCRALVLAARGELDEALRMAERALVEHDRLPMPFERARTHLVLGQIQRRRRQKRLAAAAVQEATAVFEALGMPLWAARGRAELDRVAASPTGTELTASERRVAELAATGLTNRDVAAALFISPKTVEANLSRVYHKLGIRSRAELGRRMADLGP
ncbi:helix-turn-helix transcriptional regulator [Flindersiella endophytica]